MVQACGYDFGGTILNIPKPIRIPLARENALMESMPKFGRHDILVSHTRPPIDPDETLSKRNILRSETDLETSLFEAIRPFFQCCDRSHIAIEKSVSIEGGCEDYRHIEFFQSKGARIKFLNADSRKTQRSPADKRLTVGYLIGLPRAEGVPRFLLRIRCQLKDVRA